ncbi:MAG: mucoidy inhibitor MuiA family protein [Marinobacter sp.]|nr:mucoidy inhibitor MuiA family protein [Marinobacter sp.]
MATPLRFVLVLCLLPVAVSARVTEVTLFPDQASITREISHTLTAGEGMLTVADLPAALQDGSVRVALLGADGVRLGQTRLQTVQQSGPTAQRVQALQQQLDEVNGELRVLADDTQAWRYRLELLESLARTPGERMTLADLDSVATGIYQQARETLAKIRELDQQHIVLTREQERLQRELSHLARDTQAVKQLQVNYRSDQAREVVLQVTYQTRNANWRSEYDARLNTHDGNLQLTHYAVVQQATGEDWSDVTLRLSTARADLGGQLPQLPPWILTPATPRAKLLRAPAMDSAVMAEAAAAPELATLEQQGLTQRFRIPGTVTVADGSRQLRLAVIQLDMPVEITTHLVPAASERGYIHAAARYEGETLLPAARVNLYQDNRYTGQTHLDSIATNTGFGLPFGVDERVSVEVVRERNQTGTRGMVRTEKYHQRLTRYEVTSHADAPIALRVIDRLPVSQQDNIRVTYQDVTPGYVENIDNKPGVIAWDRSLAPGQTLVLKAGFEVRVPDSEELPWLP